MIAQGTLLALADELLVCVEAELVATPGGAPSRSCVVPGALIADDECCNGGQLAIAVVGTFLSDRFPATKVEIDPCGAAYVGINLIARVTRCAPTISSSGKPPSCEAMHASAAINLADMEAVLRAIACCWTDARTDVIVNGQRSFGPEGGCVGSETSLQLGVIAGCRCG